MIDTDKYEGHTEGPWHWDYFCLYNAIGKEMVQVLGEPCAVELVGEDWDDDTPTQQLMADAPLLLEEVKRLREAIKIATTDLEEPNMHEETRKDLLDMLKEMIE